MASTGAASGPTCLNMEHLLKCMKRMPRADNGVSLASSKAVIALLTSRRHLHIYSVQLSIDELLYAGALINLYYKRRPATTSRGPGAVIVVDDIDDAFDKLAALAVHITNEHATKQPHSNDRIASFSRIAIVRGCKPPRLCTGPTAYDTSLRASETAVHSAVTHMMQRFAVTRTVWHSHRDPSLLHRVITADAAETLHLDAISVFDALLFTGCPASTLTRSSPEPSGAITLQDPRAGYGRLPSIWPALITASTRARGGKSIPLVFFSGCSLRTHLQAYSVRDMAGVCELFPSLLPEATWKSVLAQVLDQLLVCVFRLLAGGDLTAASPRRVGETVAAEVKRRILASRVARGWARLCIDKASYDAEAIVQTIRAALPNRKNPGDCPPTLAALACTILNPSPMCPATALSRLTLGPHSSCNPSLWAIRARLAPRAANASSSSTLKASVTVTIASKGTTHVLSTPPPANKDEATEDAHPRAVQQAVGAHWADYIGIVKHRATAFDHANGYSHHSSKGFGVSKDTAKVWMGVVPGLLAGAVEEWGRTVGGRMAIGSPEKQRIEDAVTAITKAAREGPFSKICNKVLHD